MLPDKQFSMTLHQVNYRIGIGRIALILHAFATDIWTHLNVYWQCEASVGSTGSGF